MPTIRHAKLAVEHIEGHSGQRRLRVDYDVDVEADSAVLGRTVVAQVTVHAVGGDDAAPTSVPPQLFVADDRFTAHLGSQHRMAEQTLDRVDLDVAQDWWHTGQGGEVEPIAEWLDRLVAEIVLSVGGQAVANATTPVVTGSWGALGAD